MVFNDTVYYKSPGTRLRSHWHSCAMSNISHLLRETYCVWPHFSVSTHFMCTLKWVWPTLCPFLRCRLHLLACHILEFIQTAFILVLIKVKTDFKTMINPFFIYPCSISEHVQWWWMSWDSSQVWRSILIPHPQCIMGYFSPCVSSASFCINTASFQTSAVVSGMQGFFFADVCRETWR